jgi:glycosyltransferase involved in cell wall biosynthesis
MRIAFLSSQWPAVRIGGIGMYTFQCAAALARAGHQPHVFTLPLPADAHRQVPAGIAVHEIPDPAQSSAPRPASLGGMLAYQIALQRRFAAAVFQSHQDHPFDILEAPEYEAPALTLLDNRPLPIVTQLHSGSAIDREQALRESLELHVLASADATCAPSHSVLAETRRAYDLPDLAASTRVIPLPFAAPDTPFHLPPDDAPVLFIGRLELLKGAHLLARAAPEFLRRHPGARIRFIGPDTLSAPDEQDRRSGRSMAQWIGASLREFGARVQFAGELTGSQIAAELRNASFVVIPSLRESYSYVCCETLAAGRPVVVSSDIGTTEVAADAGLLFARGDAQDLARAMHRLWTDRYLRADLSRRAYDRARTVLSPVSTIAQRLAFYRDVIDNWSPTKLPAPCTSLPRTHEPRIRLAAALADGTPADLPALETLAALPPASLTPAERLLRRLDAHSPGTPVRFHLYGAGRHTARLLMDKALWETRSHQLVGLIDDHPRFQENPEAYGLPVISCAAAAQLPAGTVVVLSTDAFEEQFWQNTATLRANGHTVIRLYAP